MRAFVFAVMLAALAQGALAQDRKVRSDPLATPNAEMSAQVEALLKLQAFTKKLEEAGFKDVQIVPQAVLVHAKDKSDKPVMMIVDTLSMVAVQLQPPTESETTGSGSSEPENLRR
jgi:hypothetical protein